MEFETVERCGRIHVVKNGVESASFVQRAPGRRWATTMPQVEFIVSICADALDLIAAGMDTWHTVAQAAERLVELGAYDSPPSAHTMSNLARAGAFPGAFKLRGRGVGGVGQGGQWRIPEAGLIEFAERKKGQ